MLLYWAPVLDSCTIVLYYGLYCGLYSAAALREVGGRVERGFHQCTLARYPRHCEMKPITAFGTATNTNHECAFGHASDKSRPPHKFEGGEGSKHKQESYVCSPTNIGFESMVLH